MNRMNRRACRSRFLPRRSAKVWLECEPVHAVLSPGRAELQDRPGDPAAPHARPWLAHQASHQAIAGRRLDPGLARERQQRCAGLLRLENPVEEPCPGRQLLQRRQAGATQRAGDLMARAETEECGDVVGWGEQTVPRCEHVDDSPCFAGQRW